MNRRTFPRIVESKRDFEAPPNIQQCMKLNTTIESDNEVMIKEAIIPTVIDHTHHRLPSEDEEVMDDMEEDNNMEESFITAHSEQESQPRKPAHYAYWIQRNLRDAIYGTVYQAQVLERIETDNGTLRWRATGRTVAIKEMSWQKITQDDDTSAERPLQEIGAMYYMRRKKLEPYCGDSYTGDVLRDMEPLTQAMLEHHLMSYLDILSDDDKLYLIMPFCGGGELFDVLEKKQSFSEPQARFIIKQVLKGVHNLQKLGICHRDMSLENVMLTDNCDVALIIDFGMSLKIPYVRVDGVKQRCLIRADRACGKPYYCSPEVIRNRQPFDGHAVDMWAIGPMLFLLVNGFPPWEVARTNDDRYRAFSSGQLRAVVQHWGLNLSNDLVDLLQGLFWEDPLRRYTLEEVLSHPWMQGSVEALPVPEN